MIWQNVWAFAGLLLLALPVLIHLLSRKRAVLQKFPTLRFLNVSRLLPTRSPNLSDIPLLLVRLAIVAASVLALAQPLWVSDSRQQAMNSTLARVIVVDTSRFGRQTIGDQKTSQLDSARALATALAAEASTSVIVQTSAPARELGGAGAWLAAQGGRGDIVIVSDFPFGSIDGAAISAVPSRFGVRLIRAFPFAHAPGAAALHTASTNVSYVVDSARVSAEWTPATGAVSSTLVLLSSVADRANVDASRDAARTVTSPGATDSAKLVAIAFPGAAELSTLAQNAKAPTAAWMAQVLVAVRANALVVESAASETMKDTTIAAPFAVVARTASGAPVVLAAEATVDGRSRLLFFQRAAPASLSSAALIAAINSSVAVASETAVAETVEISDTSLRQLERAPQTVSDSSPEIEHHASAHSGLSDGRWIWVVVLILLGVETLMRKNAQHKESASAQNNVQSSARNNTRPEAA